MAIMETRDGAGSCGATKECGLVKDVSRDVGVQGKREGVVWLVYAERCRAGCGRAEEKRRVGPGERAGGWVGAPGARGEPGQPVSGSRYDILRAGGWGRKLYLPEECQILRKPSPSFRLMQTMGEFKEQ